MKFLKQFAVGTIKDLAATVGASTNHPVPLLRCRHLNWKVETYFEREASYSFKLRVRVLVDTVNQIHNEYARFVCFTEFGEASETNNSAF